MTSLDASSLAPKGPPRTTYLSVDISTPRAGKLLVHAEVGKLSASCPFPSPYGWCNAQFGLFVDGTPVPRSYRGASIDAGRPLNDQRVAPIDLLIPDIAAGAHTVSFALGAPIEAANQGEFAWINFNDAPELPRQIIVTAIAD